jgi:hypothetical protein
LLRFYRVERLELGVPSPLPDRVLMPDVTGAPPRLPEQLYTPEPRRASPEDYEKLRRRIAAFPAGSFEFNGSPNGEGRAEDAR